MAVSTTTDSLSKANDEKTPKSKITKIKSAEVNALDEKIIDDSADRKTCHQCRQRTTNLMAYCKNLKSKNNKPCPIKFCCRCLLNRYGEKAEEVSLLDDWKCPKCRDVCNCSNCRKKKGHQPTGCLVREAKASGFTSVSEMLIVKGPESFSAKKVVKDVGTSPKVSDASNKEKIVNSPIKCGKENSSVGNTELNVQVNSLKSDTDAKNGVSKQKMLGTNDASGNVDQGSLVEGLKLEAEGTKTSCVLEEINLNPIKKAKKIKKRDDGAISEKKSRKKQRISNEVAPNDTKKDEKVGEVDAGTTSEKIDLNPINKAKTIKKKDDGAIPEKKSRKKQQISNEVAPNDIKKYEKVSEVDDGAIPEKKSRKKQQISNEVAPNDIKKDEKVSEVDDGAIPEKSRKKQQISNEVAPNDIKKDEKASEVDDGAISEKINLNPTKKAKKIKKRDDGAVSEKKSRKKQRISNEVPPNDIKKDEKVGEVDDAGLLKKTKSQHSKEISTKSIEQDENINKKDDSLRSRNEKEVPDNGNNCKGQAKLKSGRVVDKVKKKAKKDVDVPFPQGTVLTAVADIDLPAEDVGPALQFLEFCKAFGKVFDLRKGQPEALLRELTCTNRLRRRESSPLIRFQMQLLSLKQKNIGEESSLTPTSSGKMFLKALQNCISASNCKLEELPPSCFDMGGDVYNQLDSSKKLRILNFLCDEALGTIDLRTWIDKQNSRTAEQKREATEKLLAARDKEKHDDLLSTLKLEAEKAHAEVLEAITLVPKHIQNSNAVRIQPVLLNGNGHVFWKLPGYSRDSDILLQDIGSWDTVTLEEKWFTYEAEQKRAVENHISSLRIRRKRLQKQIVRNGTSEASIEEETRND